MAHRIKWIGIFAAALLLTAAGSYRWPISSAYVAAAVNRQISSSTGFELRRPARAYLTILPIPTVQIVDVELRGKDGAPLATATKARARLAASRLLFGELRFASFTLREPTALIDLDHGPFANEAAPAAFSGADSEAASVAPIARLRLQHGLLRLVSRARGLDTLIEDVDGDVDWSNIAGVSGDLRARWRDGSLNVNFRLDDPSTWLRGGRTSARINLSAGAASLALSGELADGPSSFEGALAVEAGAISGLAKLVGAPTPTWLPDTGVSMSGKARLSGNSLTVGDMRVTALDQTFEGAIALVLKSDGVAISGSLASDRIKLDGLLAKVPPLFDEAGNWSREPLSIGPSKALALDLRISAASVQWREHAIQDAAFSLMSGANGVTATLSDARAYKGALKGEATISPRPLGVRLSVSATLDGADLGAFLADFGVDAYSGEGGGKIAVETAGASAADFVRALSGDASLRLGAGAIEGLSFEEALRRSERRPINIFSDMRTGRTIFNEARADATIENGEVQLRSGAMIGPGVCIRISGTADLPNRELASQLVATQADQHGAPDFDGPQLKLTIAGPWSRPIIRSDSGA